MESNLELLESLSTWKETSMSWDQYSTVKDLAPKSYLWGSLWILEEMYATKQSTITLLWVQRRATAWTLFSQGYRFYVCQLSTMVDTGNVSADDAHHLALIQTVDENMKRYTKREIGGATRAREMLSRMGYPSVQQAIAMVESGVNFDTTAHDFRIAEAIWGADIASLKGKTRNLGAVPADMVIAPIIEQQYQVLSIDIMFIDGVATLVGLASPLGLTTAATLASFSTL
jgi:hypothetical protein